MALRGDIDKEDTLGSVLYKEALFQGQLLINYLLLIDN